MMEQRAPKIQSEVVYQRKKKTTKDLVRSRISKKEKDKTSWNRGYQRSSQVIYQRKKKTRHDGIEGTKDLVRSRISKKEKDKT